MTTVARCPICDALGSVGDPCRERGCARQGVHFIPAEDATSLAALQTSQREPLAGQHIGDYLIVGRLGKGGFGKVLLGLQRGLFRLRAAVKLIELEAGDEASLRSVLTKFENEARALAVLQHPNIVRLLQYGSFQDRPYLAMEYVPGSRTLQTEIRRLIAGQGGMEPEVVHHVLTQVLHGLGEAHELSIVHRDIKPENVMLQAVMGDAWHVKIVDFGLAKVVADRQDTSLAIGTPMYMAPEQVEAQGIGPWTDLYAVGCIAFEVMTGQRPFSGASSQDLLRQKLDARFDPFSRVGPEADVPYLTRAFLGKALARYPEQRFRNAQEMLDDLETLFEAPPATLMLSRDLSMLREGGESERMRRESERLASERQAIEEERRRLEVEKRRIRSERLGAPDVVESEAVGHTLAFGAAPAESEQRRRPNWLWPVVGIVVLGLGATAIVAANGSPEPATRPAARTQKATPVLDDAADHEPAATAPAVKPPPTPTPDVGVALAEPEKPRLNLPAIVDAPDAGPANAGAADAGAADAGIAAAPPADVCAVTAALDAGPAPVATKETPPPEPLPDAAATAPTSSPAPVPVKKPRPPKLQPRRLVRPPIGEDKW